MDCPQITLGVYERNREKQKISLELIQEKWVDALLSHIKVEGWKILDHVFIQKRKEISSFPKKEVK